jgi:ABC-type multidrug transport system fused ATPase/permease subunit
MRKYKEVRKNWKYLFFLFLLYVFSMAGEPYFSKLVFDELENVLKNRWDMMNIGLLIAWWLAITLAIMGTRYVYVNTLLNKTIDDWRQTLVNSSSSMRQLPLEYHLTKQNSEKVKMIDRGAEAVWEASDIFLLEILPYSLLTILLVIVWCTMSVSLTLIALIFLPVAFYFTYIFWKTAHENQQNADIQWDKAFGRIGDGFSNISLIKLYAREEYEKNFTSNLYKIASEKQMIIRRFWTRFTSFGRIIKIIPRIITLAGSIYFYIQWDITIGTVFFFFLFVDTIYSPIYTILQQYQQLMQSMAKYEKLEADMDLPKEKDTWVQILSKIKRSITFQNLSFSYPSSPREVLSGIDFTIEKWQRIALIGHTGSGKSTIIQLLMRFYEPSKWAILIDGTDIYDFTLESYRQKFAAVFQDTTLFNETIRHNLEYVRDGITSEMLEKACREANILEFIESLPGAWETEVGERGLKLSWGEKQRIAIARAILADPEILILDEATSALDTRTERLVQEAFDHLMKWRTSIIIAHRLSTIMSADMIYLMDHGHIVAKGNHTDLYKSSKEYQEMVDMQHDGFVGEEIEEEKITV